METTELRGKLERLHSLILREREAAKTLDMTALNTVIQEKEELTQVLGAFEECDEDLFELVEEIRDENRRNAYLFWSGLSLVRESMEFFEKQVPPPGYGAHGSLAQARHGGKLLSGRI